MKELKKLMAFVLVLVMVTAFAGCGSSSGIIGEWKGEQDGLEMTFTFEKGGEGKVNFQGMSVDTTYETKGDNLTVIMSAAGNSQTLEFTYKVDGDKLLLTTEGETVEFIKQ